MEEFITAVNRKELAKEVAPKSSRWPRTERRGQRVAGVVARRQPDLTVVLENVHDPHNVSAVLRSCDAVGVMAVHTIYTLEEVPKALSRQISGSAAKWIDVHQHESVVACYDVLRKQGFQILTTALRTDSVDLYEVDFTKPTALVFGNEMRGASEEAQTLADGTVFIPMMGMVESLNISVACAVTLYEAMRQKRVSGHYDRPGLPEDTRSALIEEWIRR